jgi:hypothetical protein
MNDVGARIFTELLYTIFLKLKKCPYTRYPHPLTGNSGGVPVSRT